MKEGTGWVRMQRSCSPTTASLDSPWVPEAHQDRGVLSHSHKGYCERLGCREGRRRGSCCSFHSRTVPKGTLQGHGAWGQTWHLRAILLSAWPSLPEENVVFHQDSQLTF